MEDASNKVTVRARNKWKSVLSQLGVNEKILDGRHHPCPSSGEGEDRFRFSNKNGRGNFFCACNQGKSDGFKLLECMYGWDFKTAALKVEEIIGDASEDGEDARRSAEYALRDLRMIQRAIRAKSSDEMTRAYLTARGIDLDKVYVPGVLHDATVNYGLRKIGITEELPAMVAKFKTHDGKPSTYHLTYLDGKAKAKIKRSRVVATPAAPMAGGAVRLMPANDKVLGVAEGIETAYSAAQLFDVPVWATLSAIMLEKFQPPEHVTELIIFADNDRSFTGLASAYQLAKMAVLKYNIKASVQAPAGVGNDWNDVLTGRGAR